MCATMNLLTNITSVHRESLIHGKREHVLDGGKLF